MKGSTADESLPRSASSTYSSAIAGATRYMDWIVSVFAPYLRPPILEVGIGHGSYQALLGRYGDYTGIDIDPEAVAAASATNRVARFHQADITRPESLAAFAGAFGTVVCCNVLEHIDDDRVALRNLAGMLAPGGHLLVFVPAFAALYNDLDRLAGHRRRYSRKEMAERISAAGLAPLVLRYFNPVGGLGWLANRGLRHDSLDAASVNRQIVLFDRYVLPLSRLLDPLTRRWFGQSLIVVARKS